MKYLVLIYSDPELLDAVPKSEFNATMRGCIDHAAEMKQAGTLIDSQMLAPIATARTIRIRGGKQTVVDGPFAETKELLAGFNLVEAENMDEAMKLALEFPWATVGSIEVRPVLEISAVRASVDA